MERRRFLGALCALGASSPALSNPLLDEFRCQQSLHARIAGLSRHPASASHITKAYRAQLPHRHSVAVLLDELNTIFGSSPSHLLRIGDKELLAAFNHRIVKDFEEERTVKVNDWLMSETEVLFCALVDSYHMQSVDSSIADDRTSADQTALSIAS